MIVEGVGGFNFCTSALCIEPDAKLRKRASVTPDICKYPAGSATQEVMKRLVIVNVLPDHPSLRLVEGRERRAAHVLRESSHLLEGGGKKQNTDSECFPTNGILLLVLLLWL